VNNCIGHGNYRAFLLMCLYLTLACLHALGLLLLMDTHLVQVGGLLWLLQGTVFARFVPFGEFVRPCGCVCMAGGSEVLPGLTWQLLHSFFVAFA